jgi:hypothetical protein
MSSSSFRRLIPALCLGAAAGLSGCSGEPRAAVSGTVKLKGAPLKHKVVLTFVGPDHTPMSTQTDDGGAFSLAGLPVGEARVTLVAIPDGGPTPRVPEGPAPHGGRLQGPRGARPSAPPSEVPPEYGDAAHPRLTFNLTEGKNELPIDLASPSR